MPTGLHMALNVVLALVGLKDHQKGIWTLEYVVEPSQSMIAHTEQIGMVLQLVILLIALVLTERLRKKELKQSKPR